MSTPETSREGTPHRRDTAPAYVIVGPETPLVWRVALATVIAIVLFTGLYVARSVLLPVVLAIILSLLLNPAVRGLKHFGIPDMFGAAIVMLSLMAVVFTGVILLVEPAAEWLSRVPDAMDAVRHRLAGFTEALARLDEATEQMQEMASGSRPEPAQVELRGPSLPNIIFEFTWPFLAGAVIMLFLLYFLLAMGDMFLRKVIRLLPRFEQKRMAVITARHIQHDVSEYLFTIAIINGFLATLVGLVMHAMGMPNAVLWGVMAGVLNFIPYLGPVVTLTILTSVALLTFDSLTEALLPPAAFALITSMEGQLFTPLILGRRLMLNPVVIFLSLIFWGWLWGIIGALIAVPITMIIKLLCDAIPPLRPVGEFLAR